MKTKKPPTRNRLIELQALRETPIEQKM